MTQEDVQTATLTLHFVRHGETLWNRERRMQGQLYEVPLSDLGREQAREIASSLASVPAQALYSSDLLRTLETARAISEATGLPVIEEPALRERHFGVLQGRLYGDMLEEVEHAWRNPDVRPEGGESWRDVYDRAARFLERLRADAPSLTDLPDADLPDAPGNGEPSARRANHAPLQSAPADGSPRRELILVTHGGTLNMICAYLEGIPVEALEWQRFENCAVKTIVLTPS
jgi:broad specificity phosphatase PhoE